MKQAAFAAIAALICGIESASALGVSSFLAGCPPPQPCNCGCNCPEVIIPVPPPMPLLPTPMPVMLQEAAFTQADNNAGSSFRSLLHKSRMRGGQRTAVMARADVGQ